MQSNKNSLPGAFWVLAGLLYLGGLGYALSRAMPVPPEAALLLPAAIVLELSGGAAALYLGMALTPSLGPAWTVLALTLGSIARALFKRPSPAVLVGDGLAVLVATLPLIAARPWLPLWGQALLAVDVYVPVALRLGRRAPFPRQVVLCALAVALPGTLQSGALATVGVLLAALVAPMLVTPARPDPRAEPRIERRVNDRSETELRTLRSELEKSRHDYVMLEEASLQLGASPSLPVCMESLVQRMFELVDCQSAAVFLAQDGHLVPQAYRSPYRDQLTHAGLTLLKEELVEQAWTSGRPAQRNSMAGSALFASEGTAVALPLGNLGVAYVGRGPNYGFSPHELRLLTLVTNQAAVAAAGLRLRDEQQKALELYQDSCRRLETWASGLSQLVDGARTASSTLDTGQILDVLVEQAMRTAPCSSLALFLGPNLVRSRPTEQRQAFAERMKGQLEPAMKSGLPLELDERWQPLQEDEQSLLMIPLMAESGAIGVLCLGQREKEAFPRQQHDLLSMLACHAAVALDNARHYQDLEQALKRLQESEIQLVQSSKMAAVGQLAAGVAHELNTPLSSILLSVEMAAEFMGKPELAKKQLDITLRSALRARDIVSKLLYYSRDAREAIMPSDLNQVVRDTLELHGNQLRLDNVQIECQLEATQKAPMCPSEIQQVLVNLLLNARDALKPAGGTVWVRTRHLAPWLELEVEDSGPGVAPEAVGKIFDPFFTTKDVGQGTGLGLSVSKQILERHAGTLSLAQSDQGARFVLALPDGSAP